MTSPRGLPRFWLVLTTLLFALAPAALVAAQGNSGSGGPPSEIPPTGDEDDDGDDDSDARGRSGENASRDDEDDDNETEDGNETDDEDNETDEDDDSPRSERARENFRGRFQLQGDTATGNFIRFQMTDGGIQAYAYRNATIFEAIDFEPALGADEVHVEGSSFAAEGDGGQFRAVDNPTGHFRAESDDGTVTLRLASGYLAELLPREGPGRDGGRIKVTGPDNFTAYISGEGMTLDNGTISGDEDLRFTVHAPGRNGALSPQIDSAIANGTIGAEVVVERTRNATPTSVPVVHGNLTLTVEDAAGRVRVVVEGHGAGRTLLFNVERDALGRAEDFVVVFDGVPIQHADDLADVLDPQADEDAEYILVVGRESTQVLVQVPHFSTHTVEIQGSVFEALPLTPAGSVALFAAAGGLAMLGVAATWAARNRQR